MDNVISNKNTPKDVFLYLLNIFSFYASTIGFIALYVQYIGVIFPDLLNFYYTEAADAIRLASSILVIATPVFLLTSWLISKNMGDSGERREFKLRKWLIYFTLFVSSVTMIIDLITFVYRFFSGELTIRFILKVLIVLLVAASVFGYYIWEIKRKNIKSKTPKILGWILVAVVLISIILGFFIIGMPTTQRQRRFDDQRVGDLQTIQNEIINYWIKKESLPLKLGDLQDSISGFMVPIDPESKLSYEYKIINKLTFELCANFKTSSDDYVLGPKDNMQPRPIGYFQQNWQHGAERVCFERKIDPQLYKSVNNELMIEKLRR